MKTRNYWIFSRLLVFVFLVFVVGGFFTHYSSDAYQKGLELTKEIYIKDFDSVKEELLSSKPYANYLYSLFITFIGMSIIVGSYELAVYGVNVILRRTLKS